MGKQAKMQVSRDHGGNLDAAVAQFGGVRDGWLDLSTGINPVPFALPHIPVSAWTALPDRHALDALIDAARAFWGVPASFSILPVPGASSAIAQIPYLAPPGQVAIAGPTYNEHAASFAAAEWQVSQQIGPTPASVHVHPNNPDGRLWQTGELNGKLRIIDESFCDVAPDASLLTKVDGDNTLVLKSFGKFWGLAGLRLGFVIGDPALLTKLSARLGPWAVAGPALTIGTAALTDLGWADQTRARLAQDTIRLDQMLIAAGANCVGGTTLFRLYDVDNAQNWQDRLAQHQIWSRIFPYNPRWLRLGLPDPTGWDRLAEATA